MGIEYITLSDLSKMLKLSRSTIDRWRKEGLPSYKIGNGVRFIETEVHDWIRENKSSDAPRLNLEGREAP